MTPFLISILLALVPGDFMPHLAQPERTALSYDVAVFDGHGHFDCFRLHAIRADTILAGQTFITNLPDSLHGQEVKRFKGIRLPARSWLLNRAFFWRTTEKDRGTHEIWFRAIMMDESMDSVSVGVVIE